MDKLILLSEGIRIFKRRMSLRKNRIKEYKGNPEEIAGQIIEDCWNGTYFQTSAGHFQAFYIRDFAYSIKHLISLGYKERVKKTLEFAIGKYYEEKRITTTITKKHKCVDVFAFSTDSLPLLLYSIDVCGCNHLIEKYRTFLNEQIEIYLNRVVDKGNFLVKPYRYFSTIKDNFLRYSSTYSNSMLALLKEEARKFKLKFKYDNIDYASLIKTKLWSGSYFYDSLKMKDPSGDANTFPYWTKTITDKEMFKKSYESIKAQELDKPMPLRYTNKSAKSNLFFNLLVPNYEGDVVWIHLGLCFIDVLFEYSKKDAKEYLLMYREKIKEYKNFLEVYNKNGKPYSSLFYFSDESLIWVSTYLDLYRKLVKIKH